MTSSTRLAPLACLLAACMAQPKAAAAPPDPANCVSGAFEVYFDEWGYELTRASREVLLTAQKKLEGCIIERVLVVGMAGADGGQQANLEVSTRRAQAIADALVAGGWPRDKFELRAVGEKGATTPEGVAVPMRRLARITVQSRAP
jgi:outer membrane protein OmpA-like peptidoglycan-associated protein